MLLPFRQFAMVSIIMAIWRIQHIFICYLLFCSLFLLLLGQRRPCGVHPMVWLCNNSRKMFCFFFPSFMHKHSRTYLSIISIRMLKLLLFESMRWYEPYVLSIALLIVIFLFRSTPFNILKDFYFSLLYLVATLTYPYLLYWIETLFL